MSRVSKAGDIKFIVGGAVSSASSTAITTSAIDTNGYGACTLGMAISSGKIAVTATSCDTSDGSYAADTALVAVGDAVSYVGAKRYVKFVLTPTSAVFSYGVALSEKRIAN